MSYKSLIIFLEGGDDKKFFSKVLLSHLEKYYNKIDVFTYANDKKINISEYIQNIKKIPLQDYIFISDMNNQPCVSSAKNKCQKIYKELELDKIFIVIKEIEGWYISGLSDSDSKKFIGKVFKDTDSLIKEQIRFVNKANLLKSFKIELGKSKNKSFKYFCEKFKISSSTF